MEIDSIHNEMEASANEALNHNDIPETQEDERETEIQDKTNVVEDIAITVKVLINLQDDRNALFNAQENIVIKPEIIINGEDTEPATYDNIYKERSSIADVALKRTHNAKRKKSKRLRKKAQRQNTETTNTNYPLTKSKRQRINKKKKMQAIVEELQRLQQENDRIKLQVIELERQNHALQANTPVAVYL